MATKQTEETPRTTMYNYFPEELRLITAPEHPLYDYRMELPVDQGLVDSIYVEGVLESVLARRDGNQIEVIDGRQRVRAAQIANERRVKDGLEPLRVPVRVVRVGDDNKLTNLVYAANIHVDDPPDIRAKKVADAVNKRGMGRNEVALAMGVSVAAVDNWLAFLDLSPKVQKAVKDGKISETAARGLAKLERAEQDKALEVMLEKGLTKGANAARAVRRVAKGQPVGERLKRGEGKSRPRPLLESVLEHLDAYPGLDKITINASTVGVFLRWMLGNNEAREQLPDVILECIAAATGDLL